jgi:hypothetical protein
VARYAVKLLGPFRCFSFFRSKTSQSFPFLLFLTSKAPQFIQLLLNYCVLEIQWVRDCCLTPSEHFRLYRDEKTVTFWWDDNVCFFLDEIADRHLPIGHIIFNTSQQVLLLFIMFYAWWRSCKYQSYSFLNDTTRDKTNDLPYSKHAEHYTTEAVYTIDCYLWQLRLLRVYSGREQCH